MLTKAMTKSYIFKTVLTSNNIQGLFRAEDAFQSLKNKYGAHTCHLLRINSNPSADLNCADPWASLLKHRLANFDSLNTASVEECNGVLVDNADAPSTNMFSLSLKIDL